MLWSKLSRRLFLRLSAVAAGSALAACAPTPVPPTPIPPTAVPKATAVPPAAVPPTAAPKATVAPTAVPPTAAPKATAVPPTAVPPTAAPKAAAYKESPLLAEMVKAGKLPPVEQRVPKEPLVVQPFDKIGKYGGRLRTASTETNLWFYTHTRCVGLFRYNQTGTAFSPDVAKSFKWSADLKTLTIELREGHKWSDGAPFTTDDMLFWWEDVHLNKDITPTLSSFWQPGGKPMEVKKVSPTVVEYSFAIPYPPIMDQLGRSWFSSDPEFFLPKHYMSQFHIKYNPKADDLAKEQKLDKWITLFGNNRGRAGQSNLYIIGRPYVWMWVPDQQSTERATAMRNPYYHVVDPEGNQLPYIDYCDCILTGNKEVQVLKGASGELDFDTWYMSLDDMPVLKQNEQKAGYRILLPESIRTSACILFPVWTCKDEFLQKLFHTKDFRVAMSIGIDRQRMNDTLFFGMAKPHPALPLPSMSFFDPAWSKMHIEYDPDRANKLLDGLGLTRRDAQGFRVRTDNQERMSILVEIVNLEYPKEKMCEMVSEDWKKIGLELIPKVQGAPLFSQRSAANEVVMCTHHTDRTTLGGRAQPSYFLVDYQATYWGREYGRWFETNGTAGVEPPQDIKDAKAVLDKWRLTLPDSPEFIQYGREYFKWYAEELPFIGTVGFVPQPLLVSNKLRNVPDKDIYWGADTSFLPPYWPETWYYEG